MPEILLSVHHITEATAEWLFGSKWDALIDDDFVPQDLIEVSNWCKAKGIRVVGFVQDGQVVDDLPLYYREDHCVN
jgi:hypothetical protein